MAIDRKSFTKTKFQNIKIHKDGITFWFYFTVAGKQYNKLWESNLRHTKADRLRQAQKHLEELKQEVEHRTSITADVDATVAMYWKKVKALKGWRDRLVKKYDYYYEKHLTGLSKKKIRDVKPSHFTTLNAELKNKGLAPRTQLEAYEILKPIFEQAVEDEIIVKSPIKKSHVPKRKQLEEKKIITDAETKYRQVYEAINTLFGSEQIVTVGDNIEIQCHDNPHHRAAFLFGFHGRRLQETLHLRWEDIDFDNSVYIIRGVNSKVNTDMEFTLPSDIASALTKFRNHEGNIFVVKSLDVHHQKIRDFTGIPEFSFHWMRNLSVSALSAMGVEITHLSAMLGHTDGSTIRKYLSLQRKASTTVTNNASAKLLGI